MSFRFSTDQKDVAKNVYKVDQELGGGELSLSARKKKWQIPGGVPGGAWLQVKLNHDDYKTSKNDLCFSGWMDG